LRQINQNQTDKAINFLKFLKKFGNPAIYFHFYDII